MLLGWLQHNAGLNIALKKPWPAELEVSSPVCLVLGSELFGMATCPL